MASIIRPTFFKSLSSFVNSSILIKRSVVASEAIPPITYSGDTTVSDTFYTAEHRSLQRSLSKIIEKDINPYVDQWEREGQFPAKEIFKTLGKAGFLGVHKPKEYGGLDLDYSYNMAFLEELASINCGGVPLAVAVQTDMATPALARFGSDKLKKEFLAPTIAGDFVSCIGVSEVGAGSDVANIKTKATHSGDDLVIKGGKMWITNACQADWMCLLAVTGGEHPHKNKSLICVPMNTKGITIAKKIDKLGMRSSDTAEIYFEDVRVPKDYIIGDEGMGFVYQMLQFQEERLAGVTLAVTPMERALVDTIKYCTERKTFGKPVIHNQVIHFRLAELATELEAFRCLLYRTAECYLEGNDVTKMASMCKLKGARLGRELFDSCLQYWGGMGYTNEVLISRFYRDFRLGSIGGGTDEIMLAIIAKKMGMMH